ncbi:hypothetical protein AAMO2058_001394200 [Amorphochlora amoebiformis]
MIDGFDNPFRLIRAPIIHQQMQTYRIDETPPIKKSSGLLLTLRRNWISLVSIALVCSTVFLFCSGVNRKPAAYDKHLLGAPAILRQGRSIPIKGAISTHNSGLGVQRGPQLVNSASTRSRNLQDKLAANFRYSYDHFDPFESFFGSTNMAMDVDPFFGRGMGLLVTRDPAGRGGLGGITNDMLEIMDDIVGITDATSRSQPSRIVLTSTSPDVEEYLMERQKLRKQYEESLEELRQTRRKEYEKSLRDLHQKHTQRVEEKAKEKELRRRAARDEMNESTQELGKKDIPIQTTARSEEDGSAIVKDQSWTVPSLDHVEANDSYRYVMDLQGMNRDDIQLSLQGNMVIAEGKKMVETDNGYYWTQFKRSFTLPSDADFNTVKSEDKGDGFLTLTAMKKLKPGEDDDVKRPFNDTVDSPMKGTVKSADDSFGNEEAKPEDNDSGTVGPTA